MRVRLEGSVLRRPAGLPPSTRLLHSRTAALLAATEYGWDAPMTSTAKPVPLAVVEDHDRVRRELCRTLQDHPSVVDLVAVCDSAEALLERLPELLCQVALVDLGLPGMQGQQLIQKLARERPEIRCIALTVFTDEENVLDAVRSGAYGYLLKDEPTNRLLEAIRDAAEGNYPFSSRIAGILVGKLNLSSSGVVLTEREEQLTRLLAQGHTYAECAAAMDVKLSTVQTHVKNLYRKLNINSRREIQLWTRKHLS